MNKVKNTIVRRIRSKRRGWVFSPKDFLDIGNRDAVDKVLSRLTTEGMIRRIGRGIYDFPKQHKVLGTLLPSPDNIAGVIAAKSRNKVVFPSGAMAANMLGLSTQVPVRPVYLTNGPTKIQKVGKQIIKLKHARVALLDNEPYIINLMIQALFYFGSNNITDSIIQQCANMLSSKDINTLVKNASNVPGWMVSVIHEIKEAHYGKVFQTA